MFWPPDKDVGRNTADKIIDIRMRANTEDGHDNALAMLALLEHSRWHTHHLMV